MCLSIKDRLHVAIVAYSFCSIKKESFEGMQMPDFSVYSVQVQSKRLFCASVSQLHMLIIKVHTILCSIIQSYIVLSLLGGSDLT